MTNKDDLNIKDKLFYLLVNFSGDGSILQANTYNRKYLVKLVLRMT